MKKQTSHTPGPWTVGNADWSKAGFARYEITSQKHICTGDARLIAAAPDLLEALQGLLIQMMVWDVDDAFNTSDLARDVRAAITKATGGAA